MAGGRRRGLAREWKARVKLRAGPGRETGGRRSTERIDTAPANNPSTNAGRPACPFGPAWFARAQRFGRSGAPRCATSATSDSGKCFCPQSTSARSTGRNSAPRSVSV